MILYTNFKEFLYEQLKKRSIKNPGYSLRAFARDINVSPSQLSSYLNGNKGLSKEMGQKILSKFNLSVLQQKFLLASLLSEHGRSKKEQEEGVQEICNITQNTYYSLDEEKFATIRDWYHSAILALIELPDFQYDLDWISNHLGISNELVAIAITRMISLGLIHVENEHLKVNASYFAGASCTPSKVIREFHQQVIEKASASIENQDTYERDLSALFLSVDSSQFLEARDFIREFRDAFDRKFSMQIPTEKKNAVYAFAIQFFKVSIDHSKEQAATEVIA